MPSLTRWLLLPLLCLGALARPEPGLAQSLSPMEKDGLTPTAAKGFRLTVGNPYDRRMTFIAVPMQPDYETPATGAQVRPARITLAPGHSRPVVFMFDIDPAQKERTIALCIMPEGLEGPILPRVCGRYTGRMR